MGGWTSVPELSSGEGSDPEKDFSEKSESSKKERKRRGKAKIWKKEKEFDSFEEAETFVKSEKIWSRSSDSRTLEGRKITYRCNKSSKKESQQCRVSIHLHLQADSQQVTLYKSEDDHDYHTDERGIPEDVQKEIKLLYENGKLKPKSIVYGLREKQIAEPTYTQIANYLTRLNKEKFGSTSLNVSELTKWCEERKSVPVDEDTPFVVASSIKVEDEDGVNEINIFVSTKRLLGFACSERIAHVDATYKLNWNGFPVVIVGTSDSSRQLHQYGIGICYGESESDFEFIFRSLKTGVENSFGREFVPTMLMADSSDAITNGFEKVFGKCIVRLMCFFHVLENIEGKLKPIESKTRNSILADIKLLQICPSPEEFEAAVLLFFTKWKQSTSDNVIGVIAYFEKTWIRRHKNWYEGACLKSPSTNNCLEATNGIIKREYTFRERLPLGQFLDCIERRICAHWSSDRNPTHTNYKRFETDTSISLETWTKSYQWARSGVEIRLKDAGAKIGVYNIPSTEFVKSGRKFSSSFVEAWNASKFSWTTFEEYREYRENVWTICMDKSDWKDGSCNCHVFLKQDICKHLVGLAIRLGLVKPPDEAKNIPIGQKRKRGRPSKAKPALVKQ